MFVWADEREIAVSTQESAGPLSGDRRVFWQRALAVYVGNRP